MGILRLYSLAYFLLPKGNWEASCPKKDHPSRGQRRFTYVISSFFPLLDKKVAEGVMVIEKRYGIPKIKRMDRCGYLLRDKVRNLLLSVCKSLGIRIRWSRMEGNKLGEEGTEEYQSVRAYIPITRWKEKLSFDNLKDKNGRRTKKRWVSPSSARVSGKRRTVPNLLIGKGFDALIFAYERVNQLDLLAANGTFLSQPMVRKAMVVIEVQIREYPRFRLFPRFRNALANQGKKLSDYLRCHTAPFIEERDQTAANKAMKLTRKRYVACLVSKEMRILELASGVQGYLRLSLSSLDTEIRLRSGLLLYFDSDSFVER
ncbi:outer membrane usher protein faeD [Striga asiatica]|uniref:Outer membrane usher protein faeD n=1 Tax=Striga asiatica TaxID=4170 RepID=A0A5A7Q1I1_STRAF|nr:outer membrane usher protein faeD [Striga asiatica]